MHMKICPRYPFLKSLSSGKGLAIASLQGHRTVQTIYPVTSSDGVHSPSIVMLNEVKHLYHEDPL